MHPVLLQLCAEIEACVATVKSAAPFSQPFNLATNYWGSPGITPQFILKRLSNIYEKISSLDVESLGDSEAELQAFVSSLQFARANTIPQFPSTNAQTAVPALLITLDALDSAIGPFVEALDDAADKTSKTLKRVGQQVRGIESRLRELSPRTSSIQQMVERIEFAYEAADQLPTDMEGLSEARHKIESISVEAEKDRAQILVARDEITALKSSLEAIQIQAAEVLKKCESVYSSATSVGLAAAFTERSKSLDTSMWLWLVGLISALAVGGYVGTGQLQTLTQLLTQPGGASAPLIALNITLAVLSVGAPVWFAWLATKQVGQRFRLSEDYAFKASISRAYDGYSREAGRVDSKLEAKLLQSALSRLDEQPLRLVESASYGSPWHELLASDVVKDAMKSVPNFASQLKDFASDALGKLKSRPENVAANAAQSVVPPGEEKTSPVSTP
jgi:uncharacterized protein YoxC